MIYNVSGLIQDGIGSTRKYPIEGTITGENDQPECVSGEVELLTTKAGILARVRAVANASVTCSRCLTPVDDELEVDFEEEFLATVDVRTGHFLTDRPAEAAEAFLIDAHHMLDLTEAVRQYREASARMQPLCRPDCRGLCSSCGRDLNLGDCDCESGAIDARLAGLAELLSNGDRPSAAFSGGAILEGKE